MASQPAATDRGPSVRRNGIDNRKTAGVANLLLNTDAADLAGLQGERTMSWNAAKSSRSRRVFQTVATEIGLPRAPLIGLPRATGIGLSLVFVIGLFLFVSPRGIATPRPALGVTGQGRAEPNMTAVRLNGFALLDAEYLNFVGTTPVRYPEEVHWGFQAPGSTPAARACARRGYRQVVALLQGNPPLLQSLRASGATRVFYLWINDYSRSGDRVEERLAGLTHWPHDRDYHLGSWKWVVALARNGRCLVPTQQQVESSLRAAIDGLRR